MLDRVKGLLGPNLSIFVLSTLFGISARVDRFLELFLRQDSGEALVPALARNFDFAGALLWGVGAGALGTAIAAAAAFAGARFRAASFDEVLAALAPAYVTLLVPAGLTLVCLVSLALSPTYPYGIGIVLSLALEGSFATLLTLGLFGGALLHALWFALGPWDESGALPPHRLERHVPAFLAAASLVLFTLATPGNFYEEGAGQGNMFKYLRMVSALAGSGSLDIERAGESGEAGFLSRLPAIAATYVSESGKLLSRFARAAAEGDLYVGEMRASRANRSMFRSEEGGIYYINAPGPGILLLPAHLLDRFLNRLFDSDRQLAVILFWQLLGALLVVEIYLAASEIGGRPAAAIVGLSFALAVPILFYTFQIYPELPAALFLLHAFRKLVLDPLPSRASVLLAGLALAALPWLHQKYSVVAAVLATYGALRFVRTERAKLALLALPLALSAYSIFLYNHALTGSLSPTATFTAAGRSSFEPHDFPKGFLGLLFDRENGLFVFAPIYLLGLVGLPAFASRHRFLLAPFLLVLFSYLFVIASFPYWPGAVSTMGRYILSVLPLLALPAALVVRRTFSDGIVAGPSVVLAAASLAVSASFVRDLVPSYQPLLLWDRVLYSDPSQYLPTFLSEGILGSGPAHVPKLLGELLVVGVLVYWLGDRVEDRSVLAEARARGYPRKMSAGAGALLAGVVALGAILERFPANASDSTKPVFRETLKLGSGRELDVLGEHGFEGEGVWVPGGGRSRFRLLTREPVHALRLVLSNGPEENVVEVRERGGPAAELVLPPEGPHEREVLLRKPYRFDGPRGRRFVYVFDVRSRGGFVPKDEGRGDDERRLGTYVRVR